MNYRNCRVCGEPPFGEEYSCGHSQDPPARTILSEDERATITNGLRVAAERFKEHARDLLTPDDRNPVIPAGYRSLAEQFERQCAESVKLAQQIENAESVEVIG